VLVTSRYGNGFRGLGGVKHLRSSIVQSTDAFLLSAIRRTENNAGLSFRAVPNDAAAAMIAGGRQRVYCTFKAVECMARACH